MPSESAPDPADAIAAALAKLRGRRMPRPPWDPGHNPSHETPADASFSPSHPHRGEPPWMRGHHGRGGAPGMPPWAGAVRMGGPARLRMLEALAAASGPLSVSELAASVGVDQPRASRLVQQAAQMGLVRREADPEDARRTRIVLTENGTALVRGFRGERRETIDSALGAFTDDERVELARLLTKLADSWPR